MSSLFINYRSSRKKLIKYQANTSFVIMSVILTTTLFYKALLLQGEIWCWSILGFKGLNISCTSYRVLVLTVHLCLTNKLTRLFTKERVIGNKTLERHWRIWRSILLRNKALLEQGSMVGPVRSVALFCPTSELYFSISGTFLLS